MTAHRFAALAVTGLAAGLLSGLFGVGGGVIMVPLMGALLLMPQKTASSTSLLAIVPISGAAAIGYAVNGNIDYRAGGLLLIGGIVGGQVGGRLLPRVRVATLQIGFGLLSIATAIRLLWPVGNEALLPSGDLIGDVLLVAVGFTAGVLAALFGIGGGIILVPAMVLLGGANADVARGTSLLVVIGTAITTCVSLIRAGFIDVRAGLTAGIVGAPAGLVGAGLGQWLPQQVALWLFAALLVYSGVRVMRGARATPTTGATQPANR